MSTEGQIGIYWGSNSFSIVENISGQISNVLQIPFDTEIKEDDESSVPDELKFPTILKKTFEFRSIKTKNSNLSIPTSDLIFRSFEIPFMNKNEIASVVEFEITKYIPLKLEDLVYTYHTVPSDNTKQKSLDVLFLAIRRSRFDEMAGAVSRSGLKINHIEPAPVSLIHLLKHHRILNKKEVVSFLEIGSDSSEIVIIEDETINFMRKLNVTLSHIDVASLQGALLNEIRVSFNFYTRQHSSADISKIIIISEQNIPNIDTLLSKDLNIPVSFLPIERFIPIEDCQTIPHLTALGSTLRKGKFSPKYFDLSSEAIEMQRSGKDPFDDIKRYARMGGITLVGIIACFLTVFLSNKMLSSYQARINDIKSKLGSFETLSESDLTTKKNNVISEIKTYTSTRYRSNLSLIISEISQALPEGTWLTSIQFTYEDKAEKDNANVQISLSGKIYSADPNDQFRILNKFIENLKTNEKLNTFYTNVSRDSASRAIEGEHTLTTFQISCK